MLYRLAKTYKPAVTSSPQINFQNGCIVIKQYVVSGEKPTVNIFFNNKPLPRTPKYSTEVAQEDLAHLITFRIKEVQIYFMLLI